MLEEGILLLRPCSTFPAAPAGLASLTPSQVIHACSGAVLGVAGWRKPQSWTWLSWLLPPVLAVHENDDAPLLFTVHRRWRWLSSWEVRDADGRVVGTVCGPLLRDRLGRRLALCEREESDNSVRVRDDTGCHLMSLTTLPHERRLTFALAVEKDPFLKMLLLAAALLLDPHLLRHMTDPTTPVSPQTTAGPLSPDE